MTEGTREHPSSTEDQLRLAIVAGGQPPAEHLAALIAVFTSPAAFTNLGDPHDDVEHRPTSTGMLPAQPLSAWRQAGIYETVGLTPN